jgi:hypothetical protein
MQAVTDRVATFDSFVSYEEATKFEACEFGRPTSFNFQRN